jgi:hypothetical protein
MGMLVRRAIYVLTLTIGLLSGFAQAAAPAQAKACSLVGKERSLGPSYTLSLRVSGTSCKTGYRVVRAYDACRKRNGGKAGRCHRKVLRFSCSERRPNSIPTEFDAKVSCRRGAARVKFSYTQLT